MSPKRGEGAPPGMPSINKLDGMNRPGRTEAQLNGIERLRTVDEARIIELKRLIGVLEKNGGRKGEKMSSEEQLALTRFKKELVELKQRIGNTEGWADKIKNDPAGKHEEVDFTVDK